VPVVCSQVKRSSLKKKKQHDFMHRIYYNMHLNMDEDSLLNNWYSYFVVLINRRAQQSISLVLLATGAWKQKLSYLSKVIDTLLLQCVKAFVSARYYSLLSCSSRLAIFSCSFFNNSSEL
jgi:hypothetical protein